MTDRLHWKLFISLLLFIILFGCNGGSDGGGTASQTDEGDTGVLTYTISGEVYFDTADRIYITSDLIETFGGYSNIELSKDNFNIASTTVDANAKYAFVNIPNGVYLISVDTYIPMEGTDLALHDDFPVIVHNGDVIQDLNILIHNENG